ncbi:MAG TPA: alpha/beta hydrolase [Pirellula sp.]|nr:alpha/beta hydrolase [Pirellula sp.]
MMPFSVVRTLVTGMVSWAILGCGIYLAYEAYQGIVPVDDTLKVVSVPKSVGDEQDPNQLGASESQIVVPRKEQKGWKAWAELAGALFCLGLSVGGRVPVRLLFGKKHANVGSFQQATSVFVVDRPDGSQLHGEVFENVGKPTLLLTHGWSLDSSAWRYMIDGLSTQYRIITWDHAGLGKSRGPSNHDYSLEKLANDLNAVLEHAVPNGPVILIGHSIGGMTQQTFCRLFAEKLGKSVKGLVLLHTTYTNPVATNVASWITIPLEPIIKLINLSMIPLAPLAWLSNWQSYFNGSLHVSARLESFTGKQTWEQLDHSAMMGAKAWPGVVARGNFGMMQFDEERTLPKINTPVLVISGEYDRLTVRSASKRIESLLPHATTFCDHGGHLGQWEHHERVNESILGFASKVFEHSSTLLPGQLSPQRSGA